jgi:hypothetical protein
MGTLAATFDLNHHLQFGEALTARGQSARMKRILAAMALAALLVAPAEADTLAQQVQAEAARLLGQVSSLEKAARAKPGAKAVALVPALQSDLQRFGLAASRLSTEIDAAGGPADLRCIFRGMAEETGKQLVVASGAATNGDQAKALARLSHMLSDAVEIAPAVGSGKPVKSGAFAQCRAGEF